MSSEPSSFQKLIDSLPALRRNAYKSAVAGRTSGVTSEMLRAEYTMMEVMVEMLSGLAELYPSEHFNSEPRAYFLSISGNCHDWHLRCIEPMGAGTGGTIVRALAAALTVHDLEEMVSEMVKALTTCHGNIDYDAWLRNWEAP
jgi:hypothetical protein